HTGGGHLVVVAPHRAAAAARCGHPPGADGLGAGGVVVPLAVDGSIAGNARRPAASQGHGGVTTAKTAGCADHAAAWQGGRPAYRWSGPHRPADLAERDEKERGTG